MNGHSSRLPQMTVPDDAYVAEDASSCALFQAARHAAASDAGVLILGESGVGKDYLARMIHQNSPRASRPFLHVNCGAIPQALIESELFGYEGHAFTGAISEGKRGLVECAHRGTLFLDEIGELSLENQVKLLHFLETKRFIRVGGQSEKSVDVRILCATNHNLKEEVALGRFRPDLYYRICVVTLQILPLRFRPRDLVALSLRFVHQLNLRFQRDMHLTQSGLLFLQRQRWLGNVRQLQNLLERVFALEEMDELSATALARHLDHKLEATFPQESPSTSPEVDFLPLRQAVARFEREHIQEAIVRTQTLQEAAQLLGIDMATLHRKKRQLGLYKRTLQASSGL